MIEENVYRNLEIAYFELLERLSKAAEYRDDKTGFHVKRVGEISAIVAEAMGMNEEQVEEIKQAATLHDIGKLGISDEILLKPGILNVKEWEVIKNHTIIGKNILSNAESKMLKTAEIIAHSHHEKWDGTGYPLGLKGKQIPVVSQIVAVADVFDVLTSKRSYKKAYTVDDAIRIIIGEENHYFSPEVVNAFLGSIEKIKETKDRI